MRACFGRIMSTLCESLCENMRSTGADDAGTEQRLEKWKFVAQAAD